MGLPRASNTPVRQGPSTEQLAPSDEAHSRKIYISPRTDGRGRDHMAVQKEAVGSIVVTPMPQARLTLSSCYVYEDACMDAITSGPAVWLMGSGNVEFDGCLGGRRGQERPLPSRLLPCHWHLALRSEEEVTLCFRAPICATFTSSRRGRLRLAAPPQDA